MKFDRTLYNNLVIKILNGDVPTNIGVDHILTTFDDDHHITMTNLYCDLNELCTYSTLTKYKNQYIQRRNYKLYCEEPFLEWMNYMNDKPTNPNYKNYTLGTTTGLYKKYTKWLSIHYPNTSLSKHDFKKMFKLYFNTHDTIKVVDVFHTLTYYWSNITPKSLLDDFFVIDDHTDTYT